MAGFKSESVTAFVGIRRWRDIQPDALPRDLCPDAH